MRHLLIVKIELFESAKPRHFETQSSTVHGTIEYLVHYETPLVSRRVTKE